MNQNVVLADSPVVGRVVHADFPNSPMPTSPSYQLRCFGCGWRVDAPKNYKVARAICWAHQHKVANGRAHIVEFVLVA